MPHPGRMHRGVGFSSGAFERCVGPFIERSDIVVVVGNEGEAIMRPPAPCSRRSLPPLESYGRSSLLPASSQAAVPAGRFDTVEPCLAGRSMQGTPLEACCSECDARLSENINICALSAAEALYLLERARHAGVLRSRR